MKTPEGDLSYFRHAVFAAKPLTQHAFTTHLCGGSYELYPQKDRRMRWFYDLEQCCCSENIQLKQQFPATRN